MTLTPTLTGTLRWVNLPARLADIGAQAWDALPDLPEPARMAALFAYVDLVRERIEALPGVARWQPSGGLIAVEAGADDIPIWLAAYVVYRAAKHPVSPDDAALLARLVTGRAA